MMRLCQLSTSSYNWLRIWFGRSSNFTKEIALKKPSIFTAAIAVSLASLLAACGGGGGSGGSTAPDAPQVAWASPAVFVTPGASQKVFELETCAKKITVSSYSYNLSWQDFRQSSPTETSEPLYTATMTISANGDTQISASTSTTAPIKAIQKFLLAEVNAYSWSVGNTVQDPRYSLLISKYGRGEEGSRYFNLQSSSESSSLTVSGEYSYRNYIENERRIFETTRTTYECALATPLTLQVNVDAARVAKNFGTAAGVNEFDNYVTAGSIDGGKATWLNYEEAGDYSYFRFDLATGQLASSTSTTGTFSPISLAIPSSSDAGENGTYKESFLRSNYYFFNNSGKGVCLSYEKPSAEKAFSISANTYSNRFFPRQGDDACVDDD
jgi:hypothetical protein